MFITGWLRVSQSVGLAQQELLHNDDRVEDDERDPHDCPHRADDVQDLFLHTGSLPEALIGICRPAVLKIIELDRIRSPQPKLNYLRMKS